MTLRKEDIQDLDIADAQELQSDGTFVFLTTSLVSTVSSTKIVTIGMPGDGEGVLTSIDHPVESGDLVTITGSSGANGKYTVNTVLTDLTFTVVETIADSTGGSIDFRYRPGGKRVGFDPTGRIHITAHNVHDAIVELDNSIETPLSLDENQHKTLRQLIHLADGVGGPFEGFTTGAYRVLTGFPFPTDITWYVDNTLASKVVKKTITYTGVIPTVIVWQVFNTDGSTVLAQVTDTITYVGVFEQYRTRGIVDYSVGFSSLDESTHKTLRQLVHLADGAGGPWEGFTSGAYREITYTGIFPSVVTWYEDNTKVKKILEKTITYNGNRTPNTISWLVYDVDGVTPLSPLVTDTMAYSTVFETSRTRTIV